MAVKMQAFGEFCRYCLMKRSCVWIIKIGVSISVVVTHSQTAPLVLHGVHQRKSSRTRNRLLRVSNKSQGQTRTARQDADQMYKIFASADEVNSNGCSYYAVVTPKKISVPSSSNSSNLRIPCRLSSRIIRNEVHQSFLILIIRGDRQSVGHRDTHIITPDPLKYTISSNRTLECQDSNSKMYIQTNILTITSTNYATRSTPTYKLPLHEHENFSYFSNTIDAITANDSSPRVIGYPLPGRHSNFLCSSLYRDSNGLYRSLRKHYSVNSSTRYDKDVFGNKTFANFSGKLRLRFTTREHNNHNRKGGFLNERQLDESLRDYQATATSDPSVNLSLMNDPLSDDEQTPHGYLTLVEAWIAICILFIIIIVFIILCTFYCLPSLVSCRYCPNHENDTNVDNIIISNILQDYENDSYYNNDEESYTIATTDSPSEDFNDCCAITTSINGGDDPPPSSFKDQGTLATSTKCKKEANENVGIVDGDDQEEAKVVEHEPS